MTKVIADSVTRAKFNNLDELVEVCDEQGRTLGYFHPIQMPDTEAALVLPFSREELERRRQQRCGRPLSEILDRLAHS